MFCDTSKTFFRSTAGQDCQNTKKPAATLLAESLRSFLVKSGKGKEERGKRKAEKGEAEKSYKCHKTWFRLISEPSVNQTLNLRSIKRFRIA